jgi:hypothetical protein
VLAEISIFPNGKAIFFAEGWASGIPAASNVWGNSISSRKGSALRQGFKKCETALF